MEIKKSYSIKGIHGSFYSSTKLTQITININISKSKSSAPSMAQYHRIQHLLAKSLNLLTLLKLVNEDLSQELIGIQSFNPLNHYYGETQ